MGHIGVRVLPLFTVGDMRTHHVGIRQRRKSRHIFRAHLCINKTDLIQGGVPFKDYFVHIDEKMDFPLRTTVAAATFIALYGCLYLASTTAFNSIVTAAVLFLNITYAIPQAIVAVQGREKVLPVRPLNLGRWGYVVNIFAPLWVTLLGIMVCFPPAIPVTVVSMNYSSVIIVGFFGIIVGFWFWIGKTFEGPKIDLGVLSEVNALEIHHKQ